MPAPVKSRSAYGRELRRLREQAGLTQPVLAKKLRVTQATVSDWERGVLVPNPRRHDQLQKVLGITRELWWAEARSRRACNGYGLPDLLVAAA